MTAITSYAPRYSTLQPGDRYQQSATSMQMSSLTDSTLRIRTAEGDIVTISRHNEMNAQSLTYDSHGQLNGVTTDVHGQSSSLAASSSTKVTVKGNLNADEQADIQKLVDALNKAEQGDGGNAFGDLVASGELDTIRSFAGKVQHSETVSVQQAALSVAVAPKPVDKPADTSADQSATSSLAAPASSDDSAPQGSRFVSLHIRLLNQLQDGHRHAHGHKGHGHRHNDESDSGGQNTTEPAAEAA